MHSIEKNNHTKLYTYNLNTYILQRRFTFYDVVSYFIQLLTFAFVIAFIIYILVFRVSYAEQCTDASGGKDCCSSKFLGCNVNEGGCMKDRDCTPGECGSNNCPEGFPSDFRCCESRTP